ncbi:hypothetical protein FTF1052c [Francisella tularensis subsp. tularensis FSC198]|uniref:Uncharacterized protein n=2 Tax=Francisella tularensis subsp. tularensis (strain SCHU S4 / Schu 4) TaxID=177416 RepID=Q5NG08_FRATT|nr:hypothetical protein [Francisella tularensis]EET19373.1 conserved hypothetical protein [Francisella tularensis subsp. tularensis MA00-2987]EZK38475.1 hypothetical protein P250_03241 [Francisella tularensis subsp. tularensis str. SCHU S4 substr. FSC237]EZK40484.1 hypothetical protein P251_03239 [Francisella tularensis subsp. tularensis str. SCHU S4 substr. FTS-634/635]EZK43718.1 hypothetical protein P248_03241 [Francisella tularensis subsp. tularensis str. SCHU S4 substr. NR-643]EZK45358.1 h
MENHVEANIEEYKNIIFEDELSLKKSTNFKKKSVAPLLRDRKYDMDIQAKNRRNNELVSPYGADFGPS